MKVGSSRHEEINQRIPRMISKSPTRSQMEMVLKAGARVHGSGVQDRVGEVRSVRVGAAVGGVREIGRRVAGVPAVGVCRCSSHTARFS